MWMDVRVQIRERFVESNPFAHAAVDSADRDRTDAFKRFVDDLGSVIKGERPFTLLIQDPMANSWIYSPFDDLSQEEVEAAGGGSASKDPRLTVRALVTKTGPSSGMTLARHPARDSYMSTYTHHMAIDMSVSSWANVSSVLCVETRRQADARGGSRNGFARYEG